MNVFRVPNTPAVRVYLYRLAESLPRHSLLDPFTTLSRGADHNMSGYFLLKLRKSGIIISYVSGGLPEVAQHTWITESKFIQLRIGDKDE